MNFWQKLLAFLTPEETIILGANLDPRTPEEKKREDIPFAEAVLLPAKVDWKEIPKDSIRQFPVQNQGQKGSCVAETRRKLKRIMLKVNKGLDLDFSSVAFYRKRSNFPEAGMIASDAIRLDRDAGMTLDALVPSDTVLTESAASALKVEAFNEDVAKVFRTSSDDIVFDEGDLDTVASTIQKTRKGVMVWFYFTSKEWSKEVPTIIDTKLERYDARALRHSVSAVEPALYKGQEGIWIEDSAHFGKLARRFITREFYERRNFWASYPIMFRFEVGTGIRPHFYKTSVSSLQDCLKHEGIFPLNIDSTGVYGPITVQAVKDFQKKYGLEQTGQLGPKTTAKLVELYP